VVEGTNDASRVRGVRQRGGTPCSVKVAAAGRRWSARGAQIAVVAGRRGVRWRAPAAARRRGSATMRKGKSYAGPVVCLRGGRGSSGGVRARVASVHGSLREMVG
jgi:hypothetical protein